MRPTKAVIDTGAAAHNVRELKALAGDNVKLMAVVKGDAYGHGAGVIARIALENGAEYLGVAMPEEGIALRNSGISAPILILGASTPAMAYPAVEYGLSLAAFDLQMLPVMDCCAALLGKPAKIHIKIDSGMGRIGIREKAGMEAFLSALSKCSNVQVEGVFTHFAVADEADKSYTHIQAKRFFELADMVKRAGYRPIVHCANSAALLDMPEYHCDMVRPGIVLYGYYPSAQVCKSAKLLPVMRWVTEVVCVKTVEPGETISYGRTFTAGGPRRIATLPVGYGDGYRRAFGNRADVLVRGKRARVAGRVCMDQTMVDVTGIEGVKTGDEAVLIGCQGAEFISADELADIAGTISYEVLFNVSWRVPREFV